MCVSSVRLKNSGASTGGHGSSASRARRLVLWCVLSLGLACGDSVPIEGDPNVPVDSCIDRDGDGYGYDCDLGSDCDDSDPLRALRCEVSSDAGAAPPEPQDCETDSQAAGCPCPPNQAPIDCYDGADGTLGVGICRSGVKRCTERTNNWIWSPCEGQQTPQASERCNGLDDTCNGQIDEGALNVCGNCNPNCFDVAFGPGTGRPFSEPNQDNGSGAVLNEDGHLQLLNSDTRFEYLWVANSIEGTLSKVDTHELREVARYYSVGPNDDGLTPGRHNYPSRTAIDLGSDMFVANRAFNREGEPGQPSIPQRSSVTKIANHDCIDRNGDGQIQTSRDVSGNNVIELEDPNEFLGLNDECFAWTKAVGRPGGIARALALNVGDAQSPNGNVWAGMWSHREFYGLQGHTGELIERPGMPNPVAVGHPPYGAVVDSSGYVWSGTQGGCSIVGFDSRTGRTSQPFELNCRGYGFTLDGNNRLWIGAQSEGALRYDPYRDANGQAIDDPLAGGGDVRRTGCVGIRCHLRGGGADAQGRIWFGNTDGVVGYQVDTMQLIGHFGMGGTGAPGAGVDFSGKVWGVFSNGFTGRLDPSNPNDVRRVTVGSGPYTYSDFTGFNLRNFTAPRGGYKQIIEGCEKNETDWLALDVEATILPRTRIEVRAKAAGSLEALSTPGLATFGPWTLDTEGVGELAVDLNLLPAERFIELEVFLFSTDRRSTPLLRRINARFQCEDED